MIDLQTHFSGVWRAALEIGYDNGMINRGLSKEAYHRRTARVVGGRIARGAEDVVLLEAQNAWLSQLTDDDLSTVCCGEETDQQTVLVGAPPGTDDLLSAIFEHDVEDEPEELQL